MKNTCLFALSSPEGNDNYFSKLINLKVDGKSLFRHVQCQMICEECRKLEMEEQIFCNHVKQTPHWLSSKKGARLKLLYLADPATAIKEFGGIIQDNFVPCFPRDLIHQMFSNPTYLTESTPEYVFITVDPSGGGMSQLAICSGYYTLDGSYVVKPIFPFKKHARNEQCFLRGKWVLNISRIPPKTSLPVLFYFVFLGVCISSPPLVPRGWTANVLSIEPSPPSQNSPSSQ